MMPIVPLKFAFLADRIVVAVSAAKWPSNAVRKRKFHSDLIGREHAKGLQFRETQCQTRPMRLDYL